MRSEQGENQNGQWPFWIKGSAREIETETKPPVALVAFVLMWLNNCSALSFQGRNARQFLEKIDFSILRIQAENFRYRISWFGILGYLFG